MAVLNIYRTTIGKKIVMAVSGIILVLFVIVHMWGNLHLFEGPARTNAYGVFLREFGAPFLTHELALWIARVVLIVSVVQKSKEIGILRAMGASRGQILRVFLLQGAALGALGSLAGCALGAAAIVLWGALVRNPDGTPLFPLDLDPKLFAAAALLATLTGLVAAFVPALRGSRMDPVVAIRG